MKARGGGGDGGGGLLGGLKIGGGKKVKKKAANEETRDPEQVRSWLRAYIQPYRKAQLWHLSAASCLMRCRALTWEIEISWGK